MATSPRNELVIEKVIVFGKFPNGWVWAERLPDGGADIDSGDRGFDSFDAAFLDYLEIHEVPSEAPAAETHYSEPIEVSEEEIHVRYYKYGAPIPLQAVSD